jgi:hypothetical protein
MVTLEQLKEDLRIDYDNDDAILQRNLDAAVAIVEKYTSLSMVDKTLTYPVREGKCIKVYAYPVESVTGGEFKDCYDYTLITPDRDVTTLTVDLGSVDYPNLNKAVLRIAGDLYENVEIDSVTLPIDVQLLINQYRRTSFLS